MVRWFALTQALRCTSQISLRDSAAHRPIAYVCAMRRTPLTLATLATIMLPLVTHAQLEGWHLIAEAADQPPTSIYLAPASLRAQAGGYIEAWFMADYGSIQSDKAGSWRSRQFLVLID